MFENARMGKLAVAACLACAALASAAEQPRCTSAINGKLWPEEANSDRAVFADAMKSGDLEICAGYGWRKKWEHLTISASAKPVQSKVEILTKSEPSSGEADRTEK